MASSEVSFKKTFTTNLIIWIVDAEELYKVIDFKEKNLEYTNLIIAST